jgi:hypothetical protein
LWATEHIDYQGHPFSPGDMIFNNVGLDLSYGVTDRFAVRVGARDLPQREPARRRPRVPGRLLADAARDRAWQKTHGGWEAPVDFRPRTSPDFLHHDQLQRTSYFRLGGAVAYSITNAIDLNLFGYSTVSARSDVDMKSLGVALTWSASPAQLIPKKRAAGAAG